jgi:DNA-binding response OmpR family regulator
LKILVVEDDVKLARFLSRALSEEGYAVDRAADGAEAIRRVESGVYDLIVLDWMLPEMDGLAVCRELRRNKNIAPILMLTARAGTHEQVLGLNAGADDYMVKPFELKELVARVRALLRRASGFANDRCGEIEIERSGHGVLVKGQPLVLTSREYAILVHLVHNADKVVTRSELISHVWETDFEPGSNVIEVHVGRLREKLGDLEWMIQTVRGSGYRLRATQT